jgi:hypothetical protein
MNTCEKTFMATIINKNATHQSNIFNAYILSHHNYEYVHPSTFFPRLGELMN